MKQLVLLTFILFLPALCYAQPAIIFDVEQYDFQTITPTDHIEYTFEFTNKGDKELVIEKVVPT